MHKLRKLAAISAAAAAAALIAASPAFADPVTSSGKPVVPANFDVVSVGADTTEYLFDQLSVNYNSSHKVHDSKHPHIYSWDAVNPKTGVPGDSITTKAGCKQAIQRPDGSVAGIKAFEQNTIANGHYCIDYARSSSGRAANDPPKGPGGILYVALARDAVTYATRTAAHGGTNAPGNLTTAQLKDIYTCAVTNWNKFPGGKTGTIRPFLPQTGSGTRSFFLKVIGVTAPGTCVDSTVQQNQGTSPVFKDPTIAPNAIVPFSIARYIQEVYHSPACGKKPGPGQVQFGCDVHGVLGLNKIDGTAPTVGKGVNTTINPAFSKAYVRLVYDVVRWTPKNPRTGASADHIPAYLEPFFASRAAKTPGWFCSAAAQTVIKNYGFLPTPLCGSGS